MLPRSPASQEFRCARPEPSLLFSQLLDLHLERTIAAAKFRGDVMNKFLELADNIDADFAELDKDADALNERRLSIKERARIATNAHHASYNRVEEGLARLEQAGSGLAGRSNSEKTKPGELEGKGEGSGDTSQTFPPKT